MMSDVQYLLLIKADFSDKQNIKGTVFFKCAYRSILAITIGRKNLKKISIEVIKNSFQSNWQSNSFHSNNNFSNDFSQQHHSRESENAFSVEITLEFDDRAKAEQTLTYIGYNKQLQSKERAAAVNTFLIRQERLFDPTFDEHAGEDEDQ